MTEKDKFVVIGLMSGTSLDGIDVCAVTFTAEKDNWKFNLLATQTFQYTKDISKRLSNATQLSAEALIELDLELGKIYGNLIHNFIQDNQLKPDFIGSHGHTVFHQPEKGFTLQIGNGQEIANSTQLPVYGDFRSKDVSLGGQGAPLVPIGDQLLFGEYDACFNFGGIANVSFQEKNQRIAFDVCPFNMPLNNLANQLNTNYDKGGEIAKSGVLDLELLEQLNQLNYYQLSHPKSLGIEWYQQQFQPLLEQSSIGIPDKLHTVSVHIARQISQIINTLEGDKILLTGGGTYNTFIVDLIKNHTSKTIVIPNKTLIDFKEALIFAFLAVLKHTNQINVLKSVTGASKNTSSGQLFLP
ncbi:MAG: anhydro-N-acetylmuramic acid kinase [Putridiphycobacter sp.]